MKNTILIAVCISFSILAGCTKDNAVKTNTQPVNTIVTHSGLPTDGFGKSDKPMIGTPYTFPSGVTLNGTVKSSELGCTGMSFFDCEANGTLIFYMSLRNTNSTPITVIFPAGLAIPSTDTLLQCALLVQPDTLIVPASSYMCVALNTYCVNDKRTFNENAVYGNPLITQNTNYNALISLLAAKKTVTSDYELNGVQQAVWDVADQGQMTAADITYINSLP